MHRVNRESIGCCSSSMVDFASRERTHDIQLASECLETETVLIGNDDSGCDRELRPFLVTRFMI